MAEGSRNLYLRGLVLSGSGMIFISPDALLIRLITEADIWTIIFYRSLLAGISLAVILGLRYRARLWRLWRGVGGAAALATPLMVVSNFAFVGAIMHTSVANTLVLVATMPFFSAVLGWFLIGERVPRRTWIAIAIAFAGIVVIFTGSLGGGGWMGDLMAALVALSQGLALVVLRKLGQRDMTPTVCLAGFLGAAVTLPLATPAAVNPHDLMVLALMGILVLPLALTLFISGVRYVPAAEVALMALLETVLGPIWAWLGVGEIPTTLSVTGGIVVIAPIVGNSVLALRRRPSLDSAS